MNYIRIHTLNLSFFPLKSSTNHFSNLIYSEQQLPAAPSKQFETRNSLSLTNLDQLSKENQSEFATYNFPFQENAYTTSLTDSQLNKKTVFEVVV